ncbi:adenine DNA glycosylase [Malania oleifera]|uniref:adenine DNA glycosylase n=1 Tax=Malania oleifera TaxID=397392 RepID=UPI0025ADD62F|nr:adenine DNA glycosylase [Malania oleifera]
MVVHNLPPPYSASPALLPRPSPTSMDCNKKKKRKSTTGASSSSSSRATAAAGMTIGSEPDIKASSRSKNNINDDEERGAGAFSDIEDYGEEEAVRIRASLLEWYDRNQRVLPWRTTTAAVKTDTFSLNGDHSGHDEQGDFETRAYAVWVSEVMLQQTRVRTVIDYYNRWMLKWPTIQHLAKASLEEVNEMWAGLGYYRRARFLLKGAKMIVEGAEFPRTVSTLQEVPGIGRYTAGAIASIVFNEAVPVVDGNVVRVIARLKAISANPKSSATVEKFWKLAGQLVDPCRPGDFNQALMELGAIICTKLSPSCSTCPLASQCCALSACKESKSAVVTDYPVKVIKAKKRHDYSAVCVVEILEGHEILEGPQSESRFLILKRPDEGLLAGLWEFPSVLLDGEADLATRRKVIDFFLKKSFNLDTNNYSIILREDIGVYVHVFTHIRLKMYVEFLVLHIKGGMNALHGKLDEETMAWKCVDSNALSSMGLTSGVKKVYTMIKKFKQSTLRFNPHQKLGKRKELRANKNSDLNFVA